MVLKNLFAEYKQRCSRESTCGHSRGRKCGINPESIIDICTLPGVKQRVGGELLYSTGSSAQCSVMTQRGDIGGEWEEGSRGRGYVYIQLIYIAVQQKLGFPDGSVVKNPPALQEIQVQSLSQEDPMEEGVVFHRRILVWRIPWTEESVGLQLIGS